MAEAVVSVCVYSDSEIFNHILTINNLAPKQTKILDFPKCIVEIFQHGEMVPLPYKLYSRVRTKEGLKHE